MTVQEELIAYSKRCISGAEISGKKHIWACKRFLKDCEKEKASRVLKDQWGYYWDEDEACRIVEWFAMLRHSKGELAGRPIVLTNWQKFNLCQLYGWRELETGYKRFKQSFIEVGRKNAKSQMEAGVALYEISVSATKNQENYEYYTAGTKRDQSKIILNEAKLMLNGSPLREKFKITREAITHRKTGSFIKALSKEDGQSGDGTNPAGLILDEYHQHKTTEFYDLGLGANTKEPLLMIITTAGVDLTYPCYQQEYTYCSGVLNPDIDVWNEEYLIDICEVDPEDYQEDMERLNDEELWKKANPIRMSYENGRKKIRNAWRIAKSIPEKLTAFLTKVLNIWVQAQENGYMDMAKWKLCQVEKSPIDTRGMSVYVGFDMSAKIDLTSVAFVIPYETEEVDEGGKKIIKYLLYSHSFIPNREKMAERKAKDKVDYDAWERMGFLTVTETPIVDQAAVINYVMEVCKTNGWKIETLCFDPANASKLMMDLSNAGYEVEEVYQSHKSLNEATQGFREQVYCRNILYTYNPLLNYAMSNAVVRRNNGLIKIDKDATTKRIDPVDAVLCAYKLAVYHEFTNSFDETIDKFLESDW